MTATTQTQAVEVFVDPVCPFAWITSRWLVDVERHRPLDLRFRVMSLSVLNDGREGISDFYRDLTTRAWGTARVLIAAEHHHGPDAVRRLYEAFGARLHLQDRRADRKLIIEALTECGLPIELADVADTTEVDDWLRASHRAGIELVGEEVGTPVIHVQTCHGKRSVAFFGPVLSAAPKGDDSLRLWDGVLAAASVPQLFELKRSRNVPLSFD